MERMCGLSSVISAMDDTSRVTLVDCSFSWDRSAPPLFSQVSFALEPHAWTMLTGPSGSGKSTLALLCAGLLRPTAGKISFQGHSVPPRRMVQFLFQDPYGAIDPRMTIEQWFKQVVRIENHSGVVRPPLGSVGIERHPIPIMFERLALDRAVLSARPLELSGGECQRVNLAAAMSLSPAVLILDEPFTMVDGMTRAMMLDLMRQETSIHGTAIMLVHHGELPGSMPLRQVLELSEGRVFLAGT